MINPQTNQYLNQLNTLRYIDVSAGPEGPHGVRAYWLVPTNGYHQGARFPHTVKEDLEAQGDLKKTVLEGIEYYLVPEESSNTPGRLSHYAQLTGVADLNNPVAGGGVNRVRETFAGNSAKATVAPDEVEKYLENNDSYEEARQKASEEDARVNRQVTVSPGREPAEGKLEIVDNSSDSGSSSRKGRRASTSTDETSTPTEG